MFELLFPRACAGCGRAGHPFCERCAATLVPAGAFAPPAGLARCVALLSYDGAARRAVAGLKYRNDRAVLEPLCQAAALLYGLPERGTVVAWAPTTRDRRRARGFDQAELIARAVGRRLHLPVRRLLRRATESSQTGRSVTERTDGVAFRARGAVPSRILLVDDVLTTGATLSAGARALRAAGAEAVEGLVLARTPLKVTCTPAENAQRDHQRR